MMKMWTRKRLAIAWLVTAASVAKGGVVWDEAIDGDLSNDPNAPTPVALNVGSNVFSGTVTGLVFASDVWDYITFTIPAGQALSQLLLLEYTDAPSGDPGNTGFHAIIEGPTSYYPDFGNIGLFLGGDHLDWSPVVVDVLPNLANATLGGQGFTTPLGPGTYTYHIMQTGPDTTGYKLDFVVTPEPASFALLLVGAALLRRRPA